MPYGYIENGAAIEVIPGVDFTTPQVVIQTADDAKWLGAPIGATVDHPMQHSPAFLAAASAQDLAKYAIQQFAEAAAPPAGQQVATRVLSVNNGVIEVTATYEAIPVPALVTRDQAWTELQATPSSVNQGKSLFDDAAAAVYGANDPGLLAYFMGSKDYHRTHAKLLQAAALVNLTSAQIDALFIAASAL